VRGGQSESHLSGTESSGAVFYGHLDTTTLGGAGFASQRTVDPSEWDISPYDALVLRTNKSDGKQYTLVLKDTILPQRPDGREQSTISWEYDFVPGSNEDTIVMPLEAFAPTYRGKPKQDADPLDLTRIKRMSFMMRRLVPCLRAMHTSRGQNTLFSANHAGCRSFFGRQQGDFSLTMQYLAAVKLSDDGTMSVTEAEPPRSSTQSAEWIAKEGGSPPAPPFRWHRWLCGWLKAVK